MLTKHPSGFTLLEVLIAGFILFLTISTASLVFSASVKSKMTATFNAEVAGYLPIIQEDIQARLRRNDTQEVTADAIFMDLNYKWRATIERQASVQVVQGDNSSFSRSDKLIKLWAVELVIMSKNGNSQTYAFNVMGW